MSDAYSRSESDGLDRQSRTRASVDIDTTIVDDETIAGRLQLFGSPSAAVLPRNFAIAPFAEDFVFEATTSALRTLARRVGLSFDIPASSSYRSLHEKDHEIILPVLVFAHTLLVDGAASLTYKFLEALAAHLMSRQSSSARESSTVLVDLIITKNESAKRISYRGPASGLPSVVEVARHVFTKERDDD